MIHSVYYTAQTFSVRPYGFLDNYKIRILSVKPVLCLPACSHCLL